MFFIIYLFIYLFIYLLLSHVSDHWDSYQGFVIQTVTGNKNHTMTSICICFRYIYSSSTSIKLKSLLRQHWLCYVNRHHQSYSFRMAKLNLQQ